MVQENQLRAWFACLSDSNATFVNRSHALWGLRHAKDPLAIELLGTYVCNYKKPSPSANDLLQHEAAYCLGQRKDGDALSYLSKAVCDENHSAIIRHEAAEGLAALADAPNVDIDCIEKTLKMFEQSRVVELAETCQIGLYRLKWIRLHAHAPNNLALRYFPDTTDPIPSFEPDLDYTDAQLEHLLMDSTQALSDRFQALFTFRDRILQTLESNSPLSNNLALMLSKGLFSTGSALLRHEIAFVLGQLALSCTVSQLSKCIQLVDEHPMVRHEAAEALGSVLGALEAKFCATHSNKIECDLSDKQEARRVLEQHVNDPVQLVRESCILALDIADYVSSPDRFQYASVPGQ